MYKKTFIILMLVVSCQMCIGCNNPTSRKNDPFLGKTRVDPPRASQRPVFVSNTPSKDVKHPAEPTYARNESPIIPNTVNKGDKTRGGWVPVESEPAQTARTESRYRTNYSGYQDEQADAGGYIIPAGEPFYYYPRKMDTPLQDKGYDSIPGNTPELRHVQPEIRRDFIPEEPVSRYSENLRSEKTENSQVTDLNNTKMVNNNRDDNNTRQIYKEKTMMLMPSVKKTAVPPLKNTARYVSRTDPSVFNEADTVSKTDSDSKAYSVYPGRSSSSETGCSELLGVSSKYKGGYAGNSTLKMAPVTPAVGTQIPSRVSEEAPSSVRQNRHMESDRARWIPPDAYVDLKPLPPEPQDMADYPGVTDVLSLPK